MNDLASLSEKLCSASRETAVGVAEALSWPASIEPDQWYFLPELISLHGTEHYERLTEPQRMRLAFIEAVNFFSLNIHGERLLISGIAQRLYGKVSPEATAYLHHFLDEENKHLYYFGQFCLRYAGKIYPDRKLSFPREYAPGEEDFLFFAKILMFEEVVDHYNVKMGYSDRVHPLARRINELHHLDETRHLAFGRALVKELFDRYAGRWSRETLEGARAHLAGYLGALWREYFNPDVYRDAGFDDPHAVVASAVAAPASVARRQQASRKCLDFFLRAGILSEEPSV